MTTTKLWKNDWIIGEKDKNYEKTNKSDVTICPYLSNIQVDLGVIEY